MLPRPRSTNASPTISRPSSWHTPARRPVIRAARCNRRRHEPSTGVEVVPQPFQGRSNLLARRLAAAEDAAARLAAFVKRGVGVRDASRDDRCERVAHGRDVPTAHRVHGAGGHQSVHLRGDRRRVQTAVHDMEGGLAAENASGVVDVVHGQFADRLARRPNNRPAPGAEPPSPLATARRGRGRVRRSCRRLRGVVGEGLCSGYHFI